VNFFFFDKVIKYWNIMHPNVKMFYSTPHNYLQVLKDLNQNNSASPLNPNGFPIRRDDGFPYA
jgi:hypothetical protein